MFRNIVTTLSNCFKIPELKSRILFTVAVLAICRLMGLFSTFTGGAMEHCAIGSLGIMPYISATIIIQLLTAVIPQLSKMAREEGGRTKIIQYGRYLTVLLCLGQGMAMAIGWEHPQAIFGGDIGRIVLYSDAHIWLYRLQTVLILTTGTMLDRKSVV